MVMGALGSDPASGTDPCSPLMHDDNIPIRKADHDPPLLPDHVQCERRHSVLALPAPRHLAGAQVQQHILAAGCHRQTAAAAASAAAPTHNEAAGALQAAQPATATRSLATTDEGCNDAVKSQRGLREGRNRGGVADSGHEADAEAEVARCLLP